MHGGRGQAAQWILWHLRQAQLGHGSQPRHDARPPHERRDATSGPRQTFASGHTGADRRTQRQVAEEAHHHCRAKRQLVPHLRQPRLTYHGVTRGVRKQPEMVDRRTLRHLRPQHQLSHRIPSTRGATLSRRLATQLPSQGLRIRWRWTPHHSRGSHARQRQVLAISQDRLRRGPVPRTRTSTDVWR